MPQATPVRWAARRRARAAAHPTHAPPRVSRRLRARPSPRLPAAANAAAGVRRLRQLQQPQEENEAVTCTGQVCPQYVSNESVLVASR